MQTTTITTQQVQTILNSSDDLLLICDYNDKYEVITDTEETDHDTFEAVTYREDLERDYYASMTVAEITETLNEWQDKLGADQFCYCNCNHR